MRKKFAQRTLAGTSSLLALSIAIPAAAQAQNAPNQGEDLDEVIVTGIIGSLQRNLDIKRASTGVVDVISAEDIGKFPDSNVAASLQRVPGVSIQRNGQRGEPTGITVRGFGGDFNETLIDGRRVSTASGGRSVDFSTVGADFVGRLSVLKTPDISLSASSIGATLNVEYPKPLDHSGMRFSASASGSLQDEASDFAPAAGVLFSNTFADDTMGFLVDAIYTEHDTSTNHVFVSGWEGGLLRACQQTATCTAPQMAAPGTIVSWYQQQFGAEQAQTHDDRIDGRIAFQWRPNEKSLLTIDDNYSKQNVETKTFGFGAWFDFNAFRNVQLDTKGTIVDFINLDDVMNLNAGIDRSQLETNQIGVNFKYEISDHLSYNIDFAHSQSELNPNGQNSVDGADTGYGDVLGCDMGVRILGDSSNTLPQMTTFGPSCDEARVLDPTVVGSHVLVRIRQENSDTIDQARFSTTWQQENLKLDAGASILQDTFELQNSNTFANNFWQTWAGYGAPSGRTTGLVVPTNLRQGTISTSGFIPGFSGAEALIPELLVYSPLALYGYLEGLGNPQTSTINGYNYGCCGTNYTGSIDLALDPGSIQKIEEKTWAAFVRASFNADVAGMPFHFSAGVRKENTDVSSSGVGRLPINLALSLSDPTLLTTTFSSSQPITTVSSYSFLLPNVDMKLELTEEIHLRLSGSRTLTRPAINLLTPVLNVGSLPRIGALNANGGNPALKPYLSDNFDLAVEWYYQDNSYLAADFFTKDVTNFIVQGSQRQTINNVIDPSTGQPAIYTVTQQVNGPDASVQGFEIAWQHLFGDSGFGFNANATFVDTNKPYDRDDITLSGFAVTGLANSANFVGFYDKHGFEVRVAANWRDEYLRQFGQSQNLSAFGTEPTFVNSSLQIDLSTSYQVNDHLNVFFEALNVTNDTLSSHGRYDNQLLDVFAYGRRYAAGVRFRL